MKWEAISLGEVIEVKHGYPFDSKYYSDSGDYVLLTPGNCHEYGGLKLKGEKEKYFIGDIPERYLLSQGDLLVVMTDLVNSAPVLGGAFRVTEDNKFLHNQRLGLVEVTDPKRINKNFLYHLFNTHNYRAQVRGSASGATVRHTSPSRIRACTYVVPTDVSYQAKIAATIDNYDDLIENNRRRVVLLEESARLFYQEWFVRLRFPGYEHTRIVDGVPDGWEPKTLGDLCSEIRESVSPDALEPDTAYIGLEHMPRRSIALSNWGKVEQVTSSKHRFRSGEILFGKIRPYFHKVGVAFVDGVASSDAIVIRPKDLAYHGLVLMTVSSDGFVADTAQSMKEGSKMPRADWKQMQRYPIPLPPVGLLDSFESVIHPIIEQLKSLTFSNQKLRTARDLLLPRLMSGEIAV